MTERPTLYAIAVCSKSRTAQGLLDERGVDYLLRDYLAEPLDGDELRGLLALLPGPAAALVRGWEDRPEASPDEVVAHLVDHPGDLQRPVLRSGDRAVIARPPELALDLLGLP